ncbi:hypothetical protein AVEN_232409-1 [Araneus ventricosus]|uniref:Uncharacterized protein n=1 Tax=Araneus ventricosus TaxID=182803 RepID=A0A4Y2CVW0_ARAVE|nr:hypothetical protein AVEN_232409-1 [Araneus ventricosus]
MTTSAIASSIEAGVLVVNNLATARPLPEEVRTITGGGTFSPTTTIRPGEANCCLLIWQQLISVLAVPPGGVHFKSLKFKIVC